MVSLGACACCASAATDARVRAVAQIAAKRRIATSYSLFAALSQQENRQSKIRFRSPRDRDQIVIKVVDIVLGADCLQVRIVRFAPALEHVERPVECIGIIDLEEGFEPVALGADLIALDDAQLSGVTRTVVIDVAVPGL